MITKNGFGSTRRLGLAAVVALTVGFTGVVSADGKYLPAPQKAESGVLVHSIQPNERGIYIIGLASPPLALYSGTNARLASIPREENGKLDLNSVAAINYLQELGNEQANFLQQLGSRIGRSIAPRTPQMQFMHAFNGMVLELTPAELEIVSRDPAVTHLEGYTEYSLDTDVGPLFIGADDIWDGVATPNGFSSRGEGIVIGVIDSGANLGSPSFSATDLDGYTHANPLGAGNYLGWCNPTHPNHVPARDVCNAKVIGGWDFSDNQITGTNREAAGFEDENGHGSHTASTAGGSKREATISGATVVIQGVAPRANLVIYDACYTNAAGQGLCGNDATLASINQTVADGVIDVINYSISGGAQPWLEANSLAFLAAHNAGIFVSASAGNSGPGAATVAHNEPWVTTVAASTHTRETFGNLFSVTGPGTPAAAITDLATRPGVAPPINNTFPLENVPLVVSPNFGTPGTDGCAPYPANTFVRGVAGDDIFASGFEDGETTPPLQQTGAIALVRFPAGTSACGTAARANAAAAAGARAVLFVPEAPFNLNAAGGAQVPVFVLYRFDDHAAVLAAIAAAPTTAVGTIDATAVAILNPGAGDVMADFSSRGPNIFNMLKPDVSAPGVAILATVSRWNTATAPGVLNPAGNANVGLLQGTSMSSPHNAGAAALLKAVNRSWKPTEIKTALMTTSIQNMRKENRTTAADPHDYGAGRIDLTKAADAGLLMDETGANFTAANPGAGGNPATLNLPSFQRPSCVGVCTFERRVRNVRAGVVWTASVEGLPVGSATVSNPTLTPPVGGTASFTLSVDSAQLTPNAWNFGQLVWIPSATDLPIARMPIAIFAAGPQISVAPAALGLVQEPDTTSTVNLTIANVGNPTLNWNVATGLQSLNLLNQGPQLGNGFRGSEHGTNIVNTGYAADDFFLPTAGSVSFLRADGFTLPNGSLAGANSLNFRIYADDNGVPAGAPNNAVGGNVGAAPLFTFTAATNAPGINIAAGGVAGNISLDLGAAGAAPPALPAGRYWLVVYPRWNTGTGAGSSAANALWAAAITGIGAPLNGNAPRVRAPGAAVPAWTIPSLTGAPGPGPANAFAMVVNGSASCGASWLSIAPPSGSLGLAGSEVAVATINTNGLAAGTYRAVACFASNSLVNPVLSVPVTLTVPTNDPNASVQKGFSPASINTFGTSRLTITLANSSGGVMTTTAPLTDSFPANLVIAATPNASTTCGSGNVTAAAGSGQVELATGAQIPALGSCTVSVNVRSSTVGSYVNDIPVGALATSSALGAGSNQAAATATLTVTVPVFPAPYCTVAFPTGLEPISLVNFAGIDNASSAATGAASGGALQDFTTVIGTLAVEASATMRVKGNTDGDFSSPVRAYVDWNDNGLFTDAGESFDIGTLTNTDGEDAVEVSASITVPAGTAVGNKRLRVIKQFNAVSGPCNTTGYGQAEDYTLTVN